MTYVLKPIKQTVDFTLNGEPLLLSKKCALIAQYILNCQNHYGLGVFAKFTELCEHFNSTEEAMRQNVSRIRAAIAYVDDKENPMVKLKCAKGFIGFEIKEEKQ